MSQSLPEPSAEWATYHYSCIVPRPDGQWSAMILIGDHWTVQVIGPKEQALRDAKKHGNRIKRVAEKRRANVPTG